MKRFFITLLLACLTLGAFAQKHFGLRMECAEYEENDQREYSLYSYTDEDGTFGYYLSIAYLSQPLSISLSDRLSSTISRIDEINLFLGKEPDEVYASLNELLSLLGEAPGTTQEFEGRTTLGAEALAPGTVTTRCTVVKRALEGKRLCFVFPSGDRIVEADLTKAAIKSLRSGFKFHQKIYKK